MFGFLLFKSCVCVCVCIYIYSGILHNNNYISSFNFHSFYYSFFNIIMEMVDIKHLSFKRVVQWMSSEETANYKDFLRVLANLGEYIYR